MRELIIAYRQGSENKRRNASLDKRMKKILKHIFQTIDDRQLIQKTIGKKWTLQAFGKQCLISVTNGTTLQLFVRHRTECRQRQRDGNEKGK